MNLANHTADSGGILLLDHLGDLVETQCLEGTLLVNGITDLTLNLLNLNCCHSVYLLFLSSEYFFHTHTTHTCYSVGITHIAQGNDGSLHQVVGVGRAL